jgi:Uri superfamily endonuclease
MRVQYKNNQPTNDNKSEQHANNQPVLDKLTQQANNHWHVDFLCEIACLNFLLNCGLSVESVIFPLGL